MRWCLYVDMDAFYVSCELRLRPDLNGLPVAVGPNPLGGRSRGVVLSASYEARKFGLRSAMPVGRAHALCPDAVWIPPDFPKYAAAATEVRQALGRFSTNVIPFSIDEAAVLVDLPTAAAAEGVAKEIQKVLSSELHLPCSIGASTSRIVAKIATDLAKPGGVRVVPPEAAAEFLAPLPVSVIPGVGPKTQASLEGLGFATIGDLGRSDGQLLHRRFGAFGEELRALASGTPREASEIDVSLPKSRSADRTLAEDTRDLDSLEGVVRQLAQEAATSVQSDDLRYETVTLKVRWEDFHQIQRGRSLGAAKEGSEPCVQESLRLLHELLQIERAGRNRRVRLLSVRLGGLCPRSGRQRRLDRYLRVPPTPRGSAGRSSITLN